MDINNSNVRFLTGFSIKYKKDNEIAVDQNGNYEYFLSIIHYTLSGIALNVNICYLFLMWKHHICHNNLRFIMVNIFNTNIAYLV